MTLQDLAEPKVQRFYQAAFDVPDDFRRVYREPYRVDLLWAIKTEKEHRAEAAKLVSHFLAAGRKDLATEYAFQTGHHQHAYVALRRLWKLDRER